jgi:pleiotropic regulator 1
LSGVYALALHPALDVLMTGGRDSVCRVWDMRTKARSSCSRPRAHICVPSVP